MTLPLSGSPASPAASGTTPETPDPLTEALALLRVDHAMATGIEVPVKPCAVCKALDLLDETVSSQSAQLAQLREQLRLCNIDQCNAEAEAAALREDAERWRAVRPFMDLAHGVELWGLRMEVQHRRSGFDAKHTGPQTVDEAADRLRASSSGPQRDTP